jgi:hypothetical protein
MQKCNVTGGQPCQKRTTPWSVGLLEEIWHKDHLDAIEAFLAPNSVRHVSHTGMSDGRALEKEGILCTHR